MLVDPESDEVRAEETYRHGAGLEVPFVRACIKHSLLIWLMPSLAGVRENAPAKAVGFVIISRQPQVASSPLGHRT